MVAAVVVAAAQTKNRIYMQLHILIKHNVICLSCCWCIQCKFSSFFFAKTPHTSLIQTGRKAYGWDGLKWILIQYLPRCHHDSNYMHHKGNGVSSYFKHDYTNSVILSNVKIGENHFSRLEEIRRLLKNRSGY